MFFKELTHTNSYHVIYRNKILRFIVTGMTFLFLVFYLWRRISRSSIFLKLWLLFTFFTICTARLGNASTCGQSRTFLTAMAPNFSLSRPPRPQRHLAAITAAPLAAEFLTLLARILSLLSALFKSRRFRTLTKLPPDLKNGLTEGAFEIWAISVL